MTSYDLTIYSDCWYYVDKSTEEIEMTFNALKDRDNRSLTDQIADKISQMIIEKDLKSGEKLPNEFDLAGLLNVGRGTIREAIKLLVSRNILEIKRGKGTFVNSQPGVIQDPWGFLFVEDKYKLAMDLLETRMLLEPGIAELAAARADDEDKAKLKGLCDEIETLILSGQSHLTKDIEFHKCIASSTKNRIFENLIPIITYGIDISVEMTKNSLMNETIETHRSITNAIIACEPQTARIAMIQHLVYNRDRLVQFYETSNLNK